MDDTEQRSDQWHMRRCGMITASRFAEVMTSPKTKADKEAGKLSQSAANYLDEVVAEIDAGIPIRRTAGEAQKWGIEHEPTARHAAVHLLRELFGRDDLQEAVGQWAFISHPDYHELPGIGCSPDFLVGEDALGEIKCPFNAGRHVAAALDTAGWFNKEHKWQIQGSLWITGRQKYYCVSFNPRSQARPIAMAEVKADPKAQQELAARLLQFREHVLDRLAEFRGQPF